MSILRAVGCHALIRVTVALALTCVFGSTMAQETRVAPTVERASPGQSATLLPDGRWLLIGGTVDGEASSEILIRDGSSNAPFPAGLSEPRAGHTATVLPDGRVWVFGGTRPDGQLAQSVEIIDPRNGTVQASSVSGLQARTNHTATLMTDGTVLIVGGLDVSGKPIAAAQVWDPKSNSAEAWTPPLQDARFDHSATLLANGMNYISGGTNGVSAAPLTPEEFNPTTQLFEPAHVGADTTPAPIATPFVVETRLPPNAADVAVDATISLRFNTPVHIEQLNASNITLVGPRGAVDATVIGAEGGRLAFVTPAIDLLPGSTYTLFIRGINGVSGGEVAFSTFRFFTHRYTTPAPKTSSTPAANSTVKPEISKTPVPSSMSRPKATLSVVSTPPTDKPKDQADDDSEDWVPREENRHGKWRVLGLQGDPSLHVTPLAKIATVVPAGTTAITGRVLRMNGAPLAGVAASMDGRRAVTDASGRFVLSGVSNGVRQLKIDGTAVVVNGRHYTEHFLEVNVHSGETTNVSDPIYLPRVDPATEVMIASPADHEIVLRHSAIPGLEVRIPKGAVLRTYEGRIVTKLSITPIPVDRAPYAAPVPFSVYFTLQPGGAYVDGDPTKAVQIIYPNYQGLAAGSRVSFWNYDPGNGGWKVYGHGTVSKDAKTVVPDKSVGFRQIMTFGYGIGPDGTPPPTKGPPPGGCSTGGDPVDCATGLFLHYSTDLAVRDVIPISISRTYRQSDSVSRAFGIGANLSYVMWLSAVDSNNVDLVLSDGGRVRYTGSNNVYTSTSTPTVFYGSTIAEDTVAHQWSLTLGNGTILRFTPHVPNQLTSITDRNGNTVSIALNGTNVTQVTSPNGRYIQFSYDGQNRIYQASDNTGRTVSYTYDTSGRLATATDASSHFEQYGYDPTTNGMNSVTDKRGSLVTQNWFDANGRVQKQQLADGAIWLFSYALDGNGNVTQTTVTDPRGNVRVDSFNSSGYLTRRVLAQGKPEQQTFMIARTGSNLVQTLTDPLGRQTAYTYNSFGNVLTMTNLANTANPTLYQYQYSSNYQQLTSYTDPLGHITTFGRDSLGNLASITDALGHTTTATSTSEGLPAQITDAMGNTVQLAYRGADLARFTDGMGRTNAVFTDELGRANSAADPLGNRRQITYDNMDRVTAVTDPLSGITGFSYDPNGNTLTVTDPRNLGSHTYTYDARNRLHTYTGPVGGTETYNYDGMSNLINKTDRKSQLTQYAYDGLNRLHVITYADGSTLTITWDAGNRPTDFVDSLNGTIHRDYDGLDRVSVERGPQGEVDYFYDAAGRRDHITVAGQSQPITYQFDNANRLTQVAQGSATLGFGYDPANRRTTITLPNGVVGTFGFDNANQLTSINYDGTAHVADATYGYDAAGRRIAASGSLVRPLIDSTLAGTTYDAGNHLTALSAGTLSYDGNGNLTSAAAPASDTFTWNARNQLTSTGSGTTLSYDALGRLVSRTSSGATSNYLYDGLDAIVANGAVMLRGGALDEAHAQLSSAGTVSYLTDALGSVTMLSAANQTVSSAYSFGAYGATAAAGGNSAPFAYAGAEFNSTDQLVYLRNRFYSPQLQRFISEDPIGLAGGVNTYRYADSNPISLSDPLGLDPWGGMNGGVTPTEAQAAAAVAAARAAVDATLACLRRLPDFLSFEFDFYVYSVVATYTKYGDIFLAGGGSRPYPNPASYGVSISDGWLVQPSSSRDDINNFLDGYSRSAGGYFGLGGSVSTNSSGTAVNVGVGAGGVAVTPGSVAHYQGNVFGDSYH